MSLENASPELQLAVDLIYLLECNEIDPVTALAALDIVKRDYQEKLQRAGVTSPICLPDGEQGQRRCPFRLSTLISPPSGRLHPATAFFSLPALRCPAGYADRPPAG